MKFFSLILLISFFLPTFSFAEETTQSMIGKLKAHELVAVCAVSIYIKNDDIITNDVQYFINKFRKQKPFSKFYSDQTLLIKGKQWMADNNHMHRIKEITQICKKSYIS